MWYSLNSLYQGVHMIYYYKTSSGFIYKKENCEKGVWLNCIVPSENDISSCYMLPNTPAPLLHHRCEE